MPAPSAAMLALWTSGAFAVHLDVLLERPSGETTVMQSLRNFGGHYWVKSLRATRPGVNQPIGSGTLVLHREIAGTSLAPLMTASPLNQDTGGYAPALDFGREIEIRTALIPTDITITSGVPAAQGADWVNVTPALPRAMGAGSVILFRSGARAVLREDGAEGDTIIFVAPLNRAIPAGTPGAATIEPVAADWDLYFQGTTDDPEWPAKSGDIRIPFRDRSGALADSFVRDEKEYGDPDDPPDGALVMQRLLDDVMGAGQYTLDDLVAGARFAVTGNRVRDISVWQALQNIALQWGGKALRQAKNEAAGEFRLAVIEPPRDKVTPDYAVPTSTYIDVHHLSTGGKNLRTIVRGSAVDRETGEILQHQIPAEEMVSADPLVMKYGARYLGFSEDSTSAIDSQAELDAMVQGAYSDVSAPVFPLQIETKFCPFAAVDDLVTWGPNARLWDEDHDAAVVDLTDDFPAPGVGRTRWNCADHPKGHVSAWLRRGVDISGIGRGKPSRLLLDFGVIDEDAASITYGWTNGPGVEETWAVAVYFDVPLQAEPWKRVAASVVPLAPGASALTVLKPSPTQVAFVQVESRYLDASGRMEVGSVRRATIEPPPAEPPLVQTDSTENETDLTFWLSLRQLATQAGEVRFRVKPGDLDWTEWAVPTRGVGAASKVRGGVLGVDEYELDTPLAPRGFTKVQHRYRLLDTGEMVEPSPVSFDRDRIPTIIEVRVDGTRVTVLADFGDTLSIRLARIGGDWSRATDGQSATWDVSKADAAGVPGIGATTWQLRVYAYPVPRSQVTSSTPYDWRDITVQGAGAAVEPAWTEDCIASAPDLGDPDARITLEATSAPAGYTVRITETHNAGGGWTDEADVTTGFSPAPGTPPTTPTEYVITTPYTRFNPLTMEFSPRQVDYVFTVQIHNGAGETVATKDLPVAWLY